VNALVLLCAIWLAASAPAFGQWMKKQTGCYADSIVANPNRPTVADPADVTQYGVLELEYGWDRIWPGGGTGQTSLGGLLKFGLLCDVELRWTTTSFLRQTGANGTRNGFRRQLVGPQIRFYRQTKRVPSLAFSYAVKIPSASDSLGSDRVDHELTLLASKDVGGIHFDFNASQFLIGRAAASGFDKNQQLNLAFSPHGSRQSLVHGRILWEYSAEPGDSRVRSSLWALTYTVTPRLVIDAGFEAGLTSGGPHRHVFAGATYSIANLYPGWRRKRLSTSADR
jgi:hypothetical protein